MKYYIGTDIFNLPFVMRVDEHGVPTWLGDRDKDAGFLAWVEAGNTPEEWVTPVIEETKTTGK